MTHDYPPCTGGGLALAARDLAALLGGQHDVEIVSSRLRDHFADDRRCRAHHGHGQRATPVGAVVRVLRSDVVITHWTFSFRRLATASLVLGPALGTPTICIVHTAPRHTEFNRLRFLPGWVRRGAVRAAGRAMRRCAAVVTLGEAHRDACVGAGLPVTHVLPLAVSFPPVEVRAAPRPQDAGRPFTLGIAGELSRLKGSDRIVPLVRRLAPRFRFRIAGAGPLAAELSGSLRALPEPQRRSVTMLGRLPPAEMPGFYRSIDCLLSLSRSEAQPRVLLEAMLSGVVVAASVGSGADDLVEDGVTGVVLDPADPGACRDRLVAFAADVVLVSAIRRQAAAAAVQHHADSDHRWRGFLDDILVPTRGVERGVGAGLVPPGGVGSVEGRPREERRR